MGAGEEWWEPEARPRRTWTDAVTCRSSLNVGPTVFAPLGVQELERGWLGWVHWNPTLSCQTERRAGPKLPGPGDVLERRICSADCRYSPPTSAAGIARPRGSELQMCMVIESFLHTTAHTAPLGTRHLPVQAVRRCVCAVRLGQHWSVCVYLH